MTTHSLKADKRKTLGRKVKALRREGVLPANIFGKGVDSLAIKIDKDNFRKIFEEAGETTIIELNVGSEKRPTLVHDVQHDPLSGEPIHVDFFQVDLSEKVTAMVPIELSGEAPAVKEAKGVVVQHLDEIEVEALPTDLPENFQIDVSKLEEVDDSIYVKDLNYDKSKISLDVDEDLVIVKVEALREEEEPLPTPEEELEEPQEGEEGETEAAEGEEAKTEETEQSEENSEDKESQ